MINLSFKAAVLEQLNKNLKLREIKLKNELKKNQFLIKMKYSGICGSQLGEISGVKGRDKYLPHLLGHEGTGIVIEKNALKSKIKIGDKVVLHWKPGSGGESQNPDYFFSSKKINAGKVTTFNEYAVVSRNRITKLSNKTNLAQACLLGCSLTTAYGVLKNNAKIKKNSTLLIYGVGSVGQAIICLSKIFKLKNVIAIDINQNKLKKAKKLGANKTLNPKNKNFKELFKRIANNAEYAVDTTGNTKVIEDCYNNLSKNAKIVLVGVPHFKKKISIHTLPLHFGKQLIGSHGGNINPTKDIPFLEKLMNKKILKVKNLITNTINLNKINNAINKMKKNMIVGKVIIKF
tara:strand:- start:3080 stop:4120 length:1041 start_codon:yes stop_codon:yes gene_type:complete